MILQGNQRGGARNLAVHLLSPENEHVAVHSLRGFASDNLQGAFHEAYAVSRGTRCRKFLYSLSLNPPPGEDVETQVFEDAIERIEERLGLSGQPRAVVFHEKEGADGQTRRHAHAVWSRINTDVMKAVQISFDRKALREISRELFIEHRWTMPRGLIDAEEKSMKNFTLAEWQQARRIGKDPREIKEAFADAWAISDSKAAFTQALTERGYAIARGDRRGFVGVDERGEVFAIPRMAGVKTKVVRERLGDEDNLRSVAAVKDRIARGMLPKLKDFDEELTAQQQKKIAEIKARKASLVERQREERKAFAAKLDARKQKEAVERQARFRTGFKGLWDRVSGAHRKIKTNNERLAELCFRRDRAEKDALIFKQAAQRRAFKADVQEQKQYYIEQRRSLKQDIQSYQQMKAPPNPTQDARAAFMDRRKQNQITRSPLQQRQSPKITR
ncbi:MAG: relaxase [Pseudomonadota bacterium]